MNMYIFLISLTCCNTRSCKSKSWVFYTQNIHKTGIFQGNYSQNVQRALQHIVLTKLKIFYW